jgi:hypothetical protein
MQHLSFHVLSETEDLFLYDYLHASNFCTTKMCVKVLIFHYAGSISSHSGENAGYKLLGCNAVCFLCVRFSSGARYFSLLRSVKTGSEAHPVS